MGKASRNKGRSVAPKEAKKGVPLVAVVVVIVVIIGIAVAVISTSSKDKKTATTTPATKCTKYPAATDIKPTGSGTQQTQTVDVQGSSLPLFTQGADSEITAYCQPTVSGFNFQGEPVSITQDGKPKVIVFGAHWCPHCQREVPKLAEYLNTHETNGVDVYMVATGTSADRDNYPPSDWLTRVGWREPVIADDTKQTAATAFGLSGYPFFVVVDSSGHVVTRTSGELTEGQFEDMINAARTGTTS